LRLEADTVPQIHPGAATALAEPAAPGSGAADRTGDAWPERPEKSRHLAVEIRQPQATVRA
jgi:hypothetical protein